MDWLRLYTEILDDEKVAKMSDTQYRIFTYLMLIAREKDQNGSFTYSINDIAWRLRKPQSQIKNTINKLIELEIIYIDNNTLTFINWNKRQYKSDDINARVKRYRQKSETLHTTLENRTEQIQNRAEEKPLPKPVDKPSEQPKPPASLKTEIPLGPDKNDPNIKKVEFMNNLKTIFEKTKERYPSPYEQQAILVFIQSNIRNKNPDAILHCINSLIKAPDKVKLIQNWLEAALKIEDGKYNAAEAEQKCNDFKKQEYPEAILNFVNNFIKTIPGGKPCVHGV